MVALDWDARDDRTFNPSSVPSMGLIGLHIADKGTHKEPRPLWFMVEGRRVHFRLDDVTALWQPNGATLRGVVTEWVGHPDLDSHFFTLAWHGQRRNGKTKYVPTLTLHAVTPKCEVCGGKTNRRGWSFECPKRECGFQIDDPKAPEPSSEPPMCMNCGVHMLKAGLVHACPGCGATSNAT